MQHNRCVKRIFGADTRPVLLHKAKGTAVKAVPAYCFQIGFALQIAAADKAVVAAKNADVIIIIVIFVSPVYLLCDNRVIIFCHKYYCWNCESHYDCCKYCHFIFLRFLGVARRPVSKRVSACKVLLPSYILCGFVPLHYICVQVFGFCCIKNKNFLIFLKILSKTMKNHAFSVL